MCESPPREQWLSPLQVRILSWVISIGMVGATVTTGTAWLIGLLHLLEGKEGMFSKHFAAVLGLPAAAALSFLIVIVLKHVQGPIEFEALSFKFKGASGQAVLWLLCMLGLVVAIRLLWSLSN